MCTMEVSGACRGHKTITDTIQLELCTVVNHMWMLGTKPSLSTKAASAFTHRASLQLSLCFYAYISILWVLNYLINNWILCV